MEEIPDKVNVRTISICLVNVNNMSEPNYDQAFTFS